MLCRNEKKVELTMVKVERLSVVIFIMRTLKCCTVGLNGEGLRCVYALAGG
jgi:hypothetical protein